MRAAIFGVGLIGGSVAKDIRSTGFASEIDGFDSSKSHLDEAISLGLIDGVGKESDLKKYDLIILAIPVDSIVKQLPVILDKMDPQAVVTDMGSTKRSICESIESHKLRGRFVPSHPMAGTENSGPTAALSFLFANKTTVICDKEKSDKDALRAVESLYLALLMNIIYMDSVSHDRHVAFVSHLSHITSFALANTVLTAEKSEETIFNLASGGLESTVRLGKSSPEMWAPIFLNNREPILEALNLHIEKLKVFKTDIERGKTSELKEEMKNANEIRRILDKMAKTRLKSSIPSQENSEFQDALARYRYYIDDIDSELLRLLALRWKLVEKIGQLKLKFKVDFLQKDRFKQVVSNGLKTGLPLGLRSDFIQKLFELIHQESIELQKTTKPEKD